MCAWTCKEKNIYSQILWKLSPPTENRTRHSSTTVLLPWATLGRTCPLKDSGYKQLCCHAYSPVCMRFHIDPPLQQPVYFISEMKSLQTSIFGTGSLLQIYVTHITAQTYLVWGCHAGKTYRNKNYAHQRNCRNRLITSKHKLQMVVITYWITKPYLCCDRTKK